MIFTPLSIPDVILIEPKVFRDDRGLFFESWRKEVFQQAGISAEFVQENQSKSVRNVLRGLHYQIQQPQGKLIRVLSGEILDVAVDLRRSSEFFGKWVGAVLSAAGAKSLWIPPKFAHGFLVLSESAEVLYKTTDTYAPRFERTIRYDDPEIGVDWGELSEPILSLKDREAPGFKESEVFE